MPVDCFSESECAPSLDTPGTHVQGHISCDRYRVGSVSEKCECCEVLPSHDFFSPWYLYYRRLRCYGALQIRDSEKMQESGFGAFVTLLMSERADKMLMQCRTFLTKIRSTHTHKISLSSILMGLLYIHL
jgi:hypothetical protein